MKFSRSLSRIAVRSLTAACGVALVGVLAAPAALADPPADPSKWEVVSFGFQNGHCATTDLRLNAYGPVKLLVVTAINLTLESRFKIPAKNVDLQLPDTFYDTVNEIDLGVNEPGTIDFQVVSPPWSGSAGSGCTGTITFA